MEANDSSEWLIKSDFKKYISLVFSALLKFYALFSWIKKKGLVGCRLKTTYGLHVVIYAYIFSRRK